MLQYETGCTQREGSSCVGCVLVHRQKDNFGGTTEIFQLRDGVESIQVRHADIGHDDFGSQLHRSVHQLPSVINDSHQIEFRSQDRAQSFDNDAMIIGQQQSRRSHAASSGSGTCTSIVTPDPGAELIIMVPRTSRARSFMLDIPSP